MNISNFLDELGYIPVPELVGKTEAGKCYCCNGDQAKELYLLGKRNDTGEMVYFRACDVVCATVFVSDCLLKITHSPRGVWIKGQHYEDIWRDD